MEGVIEFGNLENKVLENKELTLITLRGEAAWCVLDFRRSPEGLEPRLGVLVFYKCVIRLVL